MSPTADYLSLQPNYRVGATFRWLGSSLIEHAELFLTVCGIEHCLPDKFYGPAVRDDFHVHFILSGKGTLEIGGKPTIWVGGRFSPFLLILKLTTMQIRKIHGITPGYPLAEAELLSTWKKRGFQLPALFGTPMWSRKIF